MNIRRYSTIQKMLRYYSLTNTIESKCFTDSNIMAMFNFDSGNIQICDLAVVEKSDFILTALHEIGHAIQAKKIGLSKFANDYNIISDNLLVEGLDDYNDNPYEIEAEDFAQIEYHIWQSAPI